MVVIKAHFDGEKIVMPEKARGLPPGEVILIFENGVDSAETHPWMKGAESAFSKTWDNTEDAAYDSL